MGPNWNDIRVAEEHFADMRREVERERRLAHAAALASASRPPRRGLPARALARVGRLLVAWGSRLEALAPAEATQL